MPSVEDDLPSYPGHPDDWTDVQWSTYQSAKRAQEQNGVSEKILEHRRQVAQQHVDELGRRLDAAHEHLRSLTPEKSPEEQQKHDEALQGIHARRAENERLAVEVTEGYTDVEVAARVLNAIDFSWIELDAGDDEGPYWRRLIPRAELFIKAGFVRIPASEDDPTLKRGDIHD